MIYKLKAQIFEKIIKNTLLHMAEHISEAGIPSVNEPIEASVGFIAEAVAVVETVIDKIEDFHLNSLCDLADDAAVWAYFGVGGPA